jgi:hypothetical protein
MGRTLLLVELKGGNDGLNTLVPYADPSCTANCVPGIGVPREKVVQLDERVGLHEKLVPLMDSWKAGHLAILQGVGYPYPNRSHFPLDRDLGYRVGRVPDTERGLGRASLQRGGARQGHRCRLYRCRHQRPAGDRPVAAHHRDAGG